MQKNIFDQLRPSDTHATHNEEDDGEDNDARTECVIYTPIYQEKPLLFSVRVKKKGKLGIF